MSQAVDLRREPIDFVGSPPTQQPLLALKLSILAETPMLPDTSRKPLAFVR